MAKGCKSMPSKGMQKSKSAAAKPEGFKKGGSVKLKGGIGKMMGSKTSGKQNGSGW